MFWLISAALAAPLSACPRVFESDAVSQAMDAAEAAFREQEPALFEQSLAAMEERLPCVGERLDPRILARTHVVEALGAFLRNEPSRMDAALGGLLDTDPEAVLPTDLVPDKHPVREAFELALERSSSGSTLYLKKLSSGWFEVNGKAVYSVPKAHDAVLQLIDGDGRVVETRQRVGDAPLGDWEGEAVAVDGTVLAEVKRKKNPDAGRHIAFVAGTGVALLATGGLALLASDSKTKALDESRPLDECEAYRGRANALSWGWIGTSVATAGLSAAMVVTW